MEDKNSDILDNQDELYEHYSFTVDKGQSPLRIDKYLMNFIENATRNKIQTAAKNGSIFVNDSAVKSSYKVKGGDHIKVLFAHPPHEYLLTGEDIPIDIVYEDDDVLAFNDVNPQAPVHVLIIPRKHIATVNDVADEDVNIMGKLFSAAKAIASRLGVDDDGYRLVINCQEGAGQSVFHHYK